jgi:N6-adenosine-specific RNA methylase IME4
MTATLEQVEAAGGYSIILADPPWAYSDKGCNGAAAKHYSTMSPAQLCALPVRRLAATDSVLFLWATWPLLPTALEVMSEWGFTYKTLAFCWVKQRGPKEFFGMGRWTRGNTEVCLLGVRGKPKAISGSVRQVVFSEEEQTLAAPVMRHSAKPHEARERIVQLMGDLPRIELFARERVPGWDCFGNEVDCDVDLMSALEDSKGAA